MARRKKSIADVTRQLARIRDLSSQLLYDNADNISNKGYDAYKSRSEQLNKRLKGAYKIANKYRDNILNKTASPVQKVSYSARAGLNG